MSAITLWQGTLPPVNRQEALRYAGVRQEIPEVTALFEECLALCQNSLTPRACYAVYPIARKEETLDLGFASVQSSALRRNLAGCDEMILFAATIGLEMDRLIARYARLSPARSVMLQAIGTERIETLCDTLEEMWIAQGYQLRPRFSPGYGDLPLDLQTRIFEALDCSRRIGVSLNESLLMSPSKSVTAIVGVGEENGERCAHNCAACQLQECLYRR